MTTAIRDFRDWMAEDPRRGAATWLILGKGSSFGRLRDLGTEGLPRLGLNHVVRETRVEVFHTIDIEVLDRCGEAILANAGGAVLPWAPHARRRLVPFSATGSACPLG